MNNQQTLREQLFTLLAFPKQALVHKLVAKHYFLENTIKATDKKLINTQVKQVYWEYSLKPTTCQLLAFADTEHKYEEIAIICIKVINNKSIQRLAKLTHRLIPYPLMLVFYCADEFALSIAPKRLSKQEHEAYVIENYLATEWLTINNLTNCANKFINSLKWNTISVKNYAQLYNAWLARIVAYQCCLLSSSFNLDKITTTRLDNLTNCYEVQAKIAELRKQFKQANFNQQVELNIEIKQLEQKLQQQINQL